MYTYVFLPNSAQISRLPSGIAGALKLLQIGNLAAVVEPELAFEDVQTSDQQLVKAALAHDRVIRELFQQTPVLPLRFGTRFISQQGLLEHLEVHQTEYLQKLAEVRGKAEYFLKLVPIATPDPPIAADLADLKGKVYFLAKKQAFQAQADWQQQQQAELQQVLAAIAQQFPRWVRGEPHEGAERIYVLGDRIQERLLYESLKVWQIQFPHWEITVGEPLPPYHFV